MCLLFFLAGILIGYVTFRLATAPHLWDAEEEAKFYKKQWILLKNKEDIAEDNINNQ
jgi:hypothetical protein